MYSPTDIANLALDAIGSEFTLGDIEDGTRAAQTCLRSYPECRRRLLRGAHWQFARKQEPLQLLGDATGNTVGVSKAVIAPWIYEYAYPTDALAVRFVPYQPGNAGIPAGNIAAPITPIVANLQTTYSLGSRLHPARFLVARDVNYPPLAGQLYEDVQGLSPQGRTVLLTNVQNALCIYTSDVIYASEWDVLFRDAMISYLAQSIAMKPGIVSDQKLAMQLRRDQIAITKEKLVQARIADGNETWSSTDHLPDWIAFRSGGGFWRHGRGDDGLGSMYGGWQPVGFADGSAF